jgi:hypothetical protein
MATTKMALESLPLGERLKQPKQLTIPLGVKKLLPMMLVP